MPALVDPRDLAGVLPVARERVAAGEDGGDVEVAGDGFRAPGTRRAARSAAAERSSALQGMHAQ